MASEAGNADITTRHLQKVKVRAHGARVKTIKWREAVVCFAVVIGYVDFLNY